MISFYQHIKKYLEFSQETKNFIKKYGKIKLANKNEYYTLHDQHAPYWCFILEGLVAGLSFDSNGNRTIHWIAQEGHYFTGNKHLFSDESCQQDIQFLSAGKILEIPIHHMRLAQNEFTEINELTHRFKQHKILQKDLIIDILKQKDLKLRYFKFMDEMGELASRLTIEQKRDFIQISEAHYKKVHRAYLIRKILSLFF